ncbi:radical SAM protein [candidate division KSB1 bacterium]|nr:radical SAM protein [candidate division KSB1 bacterium]
MLKTLQQLAVKGALRAIQRQPLNSSTEIRLTRLCTQRCRQCSVYERTSEQAMLTLPQFREIMAKLHDYGAYIGFISGGEATLVPDVEQMLIEAKQTFTSATTLVTGLINRSDVIERVGQVALAHDINVQTSLDALGPLGDNLRGAKDFAETVLKHMQWFSDHRAGSKSLLYANIVINNLNLDQIPELIKRIRDLGWRATIGMYHSLTATTRADDELRIVPGKKLDDLIKFLDGNTDILNLNSFITGIPKFVANPETDFCPFVASPFWMTRTTIMENGDVHLCYGDPIGNILGQDMDDIFSSVDYKQRLTEYNNCQGCWTTCYTQRYLLVHPRSVGELFHNAKKIIKLKAR